MGGDDSRRPPLKKPGRLSPVLVCIGVCMNLAVGSLCGVATDSLLTLLNDHYEGALFPADNPTNLADNAHLIAISVVFIISIAFVIGKLDLNRNPTLRPFHLERRIQHVVTGLSVYTLREHVLNARESILGLVVGITSFATFHVQRHWRLLGLVDTMDGLFRTAFKGIIRKHEAEGSIPSALYFLIGILIVVVSCSRNLSSVSMLTLAVGDPAAGIFGKLAAIRSDNKHLKIYGDKSVAGTVGCGAVSALVCTAAVYFGFSRGQLFELAAWPLLGLTIGVTAGAAELVAILDDNLTMPAAFCFFWWAVSSWLGAAQVSDAGGTAYLDFLRLVKLVHLG